MNTLTKSFIAFVATFAMTSIANADVVFTVTPNGANTDWTISGSGTSDAFTTYPSGFDIAINPGSGAFANSVTLQNSIAGNFQLTSGGVLLTSNSFQAGIETFVIPGVGTFMTDKLSINWNGVMAAGTDLSTISGTVTVPIAIGDINLPNMGNNMAFGDVTLQAPIAVPEPSSFLALGLVGLGLAVQRRFQKN